jgi:hypothetical protein
MKDLDFIHDLTSATVVCQSCRDRLVVDKKIPNVKYCHCPDTKSAYDRKVSGEFWSSKKLAMIKEKNYIRYQSTIDST